VGDRRAYLEAAAGSLPMHGVEVLASSSVYETEPVGEVPDQREFLNACLHIRTERGPDELLAACKAVEVELGRLNRVMQCGAAPELRERLGRRIERVPETEALQPFANGSGAAQMQPRQGDERDLELARHNGVAQTMEGHRRRPASQFREHDIAAVRG